MKKLMLMAIAIVLAITPVSAKDKTKNRDKKQKGQPAAQQAPQPPKPSVSRHGMFDITKVNADWFMEIPDSLLEKDILARDGGVTARGLADSALRNVRLLEELDFEDIVISLKSSNVKMNDTAYRMVDAACDHPLHIGVTEAGTPARGRTKSAAGLGALLLSGIGDTMRVSLTADPVQEVLFARELLDVLDIRKSGIEIVSCPTCCRTEVDLEEVIARAEDKLEPLKQAFERTEGSAHMKIAIMGCVVNGPGEAREADLGICGGIGEGLIIRKGEVIRKAAEAELLDAFREELDRIKA